MFAQYRSTRLWLCYTFMTLCLAGTNVAYADKGQGPSEQGLKALYSKRIAEDNRASVQFYGKQGTTRLHDLKKVSCRSVMQKSTTQSCNVVVDITSFGLGRHTVKDQVVVKQNNRGKWILISDLFN